MEFTYNRTADRVLVWFAKEKVAGDEGGRAGGVYADYDADWAGDSGGGAEGE